MVYHRNRVYKTIFRKVPWGTAFALETAPTVVLWKVGCVTATDPSGGYQTMTDLSAAVRRLQFLRQP